MNPRGANRFRVFDLRRFDAVIIHYSLVITVDEYLSPFFRERLAAYDGLKVLFIQDEYRWVDEITAMMRYLGIDLLYTLVPTEQVGTVYGGRLPGVEIVTTLAGYVPSTLERRRPTPLSTRGLDVVYRGRALPYWLGRLGQEKVQIGQRFLELARHTSLHCDIAWAEADRIYGDAWYRFLGSARATLGTESGASLIDFDGSLERQTNAYLAKHPTASFDEVYEAILEPHEGPGSIEVVSPRVFEAAALRTAMVNFPGRYSGAIEPWTHYIPLEKDFSNFGEVVEAIRDDGLVDSLTTRAHEDLVASGRYSLRTFVSSVDADLEARIGTRTVTAPRRVLHAAATRAERTIRTGTLREARLLKHREATVRRRLTQALIAAEPAIQSLWSLATAEERDADRRARIDEDMLRLAILTAAHNRRLRYQGPEFDVMPTLEEDRLTFVSIPRSGNSLPRGSAAEIEEALARGFVANVLWNHTQISLVVRVASPGLRPVTVEVGHYVVYGVHRFTVLTQLAARHPGEVRAALRPLLVPPPSGSSVTPWAPTLAQRVRWAPRSILMRGFVALRLILTEPSLRAVLVRYLASRKARSAAGMDVVVEDLLKLRLLSYAVAGELPTAEPSRVAVAWSDATLLFRSATSAEEHATPVSPVETPSWDRVDRIVWDHSAVASRVRCPGWPHLSVALADEGVYEFHALAALTAHLPGPIERAIRIAMPT